VVAGQTVTNQMAKPTTTMKVTTAKNQPRMNKSSKFALVFIVTERGWKGRGALKIRAFYLATAHPLSCFRRYNRHRGWTPESPRGIWLAAEDYRSVQALLLAGAEVVSFRDQSRPRPA